MNDKIVITDPEKEDYPQNLAEIIGCPQKLYIWGKITKKDTNAVAIVGTRQMDKYGEDTAYNFSYNLAKRGLTIISGLARGIDSVAHKGALAAKGRTIAVLGSGIDYIYPPENKFLAKLVSQSGAVVTEYSPGTPPLGNNFLERNRIVSGLSKVVVVIEGKKRSGTLSTATHAAIQGREVFAVPGPVNSELSELPLYLITQGANIAKSYEDILEYMNNYV